MSIRLVARDLYKAQQNVDQLQREIDTAASSEKVKFEAEMKAAKQELNILRRMLDGEKESGSFRKRFDGFGSTRS